VQSSQGHRTVGTLVAEEMDVENVRLETLVELRALEMENVAGLVQNQELIVEVIAEINAVVVVAV